MHSDVNFDVAELVRETFVKIADEFRVALWVVIIR
jgi:hypothetical protein